MHQRLTEEKQALEMVDEREESPREVSIIRRAYDTIKSIWAWGRTVNAAGSVLGLYQSTASAAVSAATGGRMGLSSLGWEICSWTGRINREVVGPAL